MTATGVGVKEWMERKTGFEPAISSLARRRFTTKPLPLNSAAHAGRPRLITMQWCRGTDSNCRHRHFQCRALPPELPRRANPLSNRPPNLVKPGKKELAIINYQLSIPHPIVIPVPSPSFPRKRESTPRPFATPEYAGVLDSGLRRNDGEDGLPPIQSFPPAAPSFPRKRESTPRPTAPPE